MNFTNNVIMCRLMLCSISFFSALQSKSASHGASSHSVAILNKLKTEMRNLREARAAFVPLGKFQPPCNLQTGLKTDHVDI